MKQTFSRFILAETLILIAAILLLFAAALSYKSRGIDVVTINDYVETVKEHWNDGSFDAALQQKSQLMILSADQKVLYQSDPKRFTGITSELLAIQNNCICIPITEGERFLGTLILPDPVWEDYAHAMRRILVSAALSAAVIALSYLFFLWYVNRNVIGPFRRMKEFAGQIAQGNLDEPLLLEKNNMFGLFTESFDLMREQLRASQSREIALKKQEKELVASLSHDLRSPVTGIRVICELLEVKVADAYVRGKIENIRLKTEEMDTLLSDLLSAALDDLGELQVNPCEVTSDVIGQLLEKHDTKKKVTAQTIPGCILYIDQTRLSQVIGNIIGNSYKYADTRIDVTYAFREHYLEMKIRDYGEGAEKEELSLLTNKFYRGKKQAADKEGSGLGLYICAGLMKKMQGQLLLSGDDGFAVTLLLPLA